MMIELKQAGIHFGTQNVLNNINLRVEAGEHIGIVGPNGAGKSTLFHLITGEITPESGTVTVERGVRIGHLHQQLHPHDQNDRLFDYTCRAIPRLPEIEAELSELHRQVEHAEGKERERLLNKTGELQSEFEEMGGYDLEGRVKETLGGLGFSNADFSKPFNTFSGGWQMRAELARTLSGMPDILLLDEPSNYLDLPAVEWIQRFLREYSGTMLLISHDRYLLRSLTNITLEIDGRTVTKYSGGLDSYMAQREQRYATLVASKRNQQKRRDQIESFVNRFRATSTKASQVQSRIKELERMEAIHVPRQASTDGHMRLPSPPHAGTQIMRLENASYRYSEDSPPVFSGINVEINRGDRVALVGFNGMGKTTLLRLIAGTRTPVEGIRVPGHKVKIGYVSQEFAETMPPDRSLLNIIKNENSALSDREARSLLGSFGFSGDAVEKPCMVLSGGEKIRLAFARIYADPPNLLLLDEPTTHLDMNGRRDLENALGNYTGTVCLVSHDVEFVRATATGILELDPTGLRHFPGNYDDFREYTASRQNAAAHESSNGDIEDENNRSSKSRKEQRRERAGERRRRQPRINQLRKRMKASEERAAELEVEQSLLVEKLANPSVTEDFEDINKRLKQLQTDLKTVNHLWEQAAIELEEFGESS